VDLRQIETFCKVAEMKSFTRAADALFLTQPAVSQHIAALEKELGVQLFERSGRSVQLTHPGELFLNYAERVIHTLDEARRSLAEMGEGVRGRVVVGAGATTTIFNLPRALQALRETHPGIDVIVRTGASREVAELVLANEVDVGLITSPVEQNELTVIPLFEEQIVAVVGANHPFAETGKSTLEEFAHEPLILFVKGSGFRAYLDSILAGAGIAPDVRMALDNVEAIKALVQIGLGVSIIPRTSAESEIAAGTLVVVDLLDVQPMMRTLSAIHRKDLYISPDIAALLEALREMR
jgi:DNA-binding transcriptional LysR family regulator